VAELTAPSVALVGWPRVRETVSPDSNSVIQNRDRECRQSNTWCEGQRVTDGDNRSAFPLAHGVVDANSVHSRS
jgi:hypothetical protein